MNSEPQQLYFDFVDSPKGDGPMEPMDESTGKIGPVRKSKHRRWHVGRHRDQRQLLAPPPGGTTLRRAGCAIHKSGSVGAAGG